MKTKSATAKSMFNAASTGTFGYISGPDGDRTVHNGGAKCLMDCLSVTFVIAVMQFTAG